MGIPETYENYHFIFSGLIILVNNSLQFTGQDLAVMLICSVYRKLDCFISDFKRYLTASYFAGNPTPKTIHNFATKTLEIATVFSKENLPFWYITFSMYLVITLVPKLILLVILGSRIHERFAEIKELVLTAPVLNERILYETPSGINHIALCHIVESLSDKAFMTAMGVIKIEKNVILSILCAFISYSVLITQVFNK
ncbi:hypothetical protein NPIL_546711 [Nephila pilipes]|uniref:Uncharacterized protein n=1 Tax=Nephila pilipes TaxID=299642 RepID=A0A8X6QM94_NEPPI|nr:hypothetical protein NPIL_198951 [Nephila pilipes]GFU21054.1 hypothetical protein NPIL_546711 [Nephila pilipes]